MLNWCTILLIDPIATSAPRRRLIGRAFAAQFGSTRKALNPSWLITWVLRVLGFDHAAPIRHLCAITHPCGFNGATSTRLRWDQDGHER